MRCERYLALPLGELAAQPPERETWLSLCLLLPFERACKALSVTFGDSSPRGRAKGASRLAMTREGGACRFVPASLRMQQAPELVIASLAEQGAAISQYWPEHGKASGGHGVFIR